ncbi:acyl carrier protein [Amycolatopsis sp. NBC_00345]|uniref:acyl carrier protein n=1 Tax=Amycolatopsis sp. NBC_00345 TaxID=2975955 RepID=UPI002E262F42
MIEDSHVATASKFDHGRYIEVIRRNIPFSEAEAIDGQKPLKDLGIDSLGAIRLLSELEDEFDIELPDEAVQESAFGTVESVWNAMVTNWTNGA